MAKAPAKTAKPVPKPEPAKVDVVETKAPAKVSLPTLGSIVLVHMDEGDFPMIVTRSGEDDIDGQAFLDGTQTRSVLNATYGDGPGQIASPTTHAKEA